METIRCHRCGKEFAGDLEACPQCGAEKLKTPLPNYPTFASHGWFVVILIIFAILVFVQVSSMLLID